MEPKATELRQGEQVVVVVPGSSGKVWGIILSDQGGMRREYLKPDEQTPEMRALFHAGEAMRSTLIRAVPNCLVTEWPPSYFSSVTSDAGEAMGPKRIKLYYSEHIVAVAPESDGLVWVYLRALRGWRRECIKPNERTPEMHALFQDGLAMHLALLRAVPTCIVRRITSNNINDCGLGW